MVSFALPDGVEVNPAAIQDMIRRSTNVLAGYKVRVDSRVSAIHGG